LAEGYHFYSSLFMLIGRYELHHTIPLIQASTHHFQFLYIYMSGVIHGYQIFLETLGYFM